jgi:hypothetical protein
LRRASLGGGPVVKSQLIASRFYAVQRELKRLPMHDSKRVALIAVSDRCERIAAANINPSALLDELVGLTTNEDAANTAADPRRAFELARFFLLWTLGFTAARLSGWRLPFRGPAALYIHASAQRIQEKSTRGSRSVFCSAMADVSMQMPTR